MPSSYTYYWEVKDILTQFLHAFDGAIVRRYTTARQSTNAVGVRYVYAPKQRVLHDLINRAQHITLPVVSFWIDSIQRDQSRVFNKLEGMYYNKDTYNNKTIHRLQPLPVDINVSVSILTRFQSDMDQIVSNFVPYSDPYFVVSWSKFGSPEIEIRAPVLWNNELAMSYPVEQAPNDPTRVVCDTKFTIKGWIFKNETDATGRIFKIDTNFHAFSASDVNNPFANESFTTSATALIDSCSRSKTPVNYSGKANITGYEFSTITNIFLSGSYDYMFPGTTTYNLFSASGLSALYPPLVNVVPVQAYKVNNNNSISLTYQTPYASGYFDIIVVNAAGYTKMTGTVKPSFPYAKGIEVVSEHKYIWDTAYITWDAATFQWQVA